ncbi:MerR family transcriptional regulator [Hazenella sp. IB182357]|uniref:MerR family transcriptional regulator n=1 Tax=Polycladospora coralii TaxID=2771432 RepID=A0A926N9Y3_9BACL|nr:MerR family transcriptional regulator [Polycladospora coralii]MBD1372921.1 MerR family transcriptional regulator [Polycladospora coralii]MBS7531022.1 MerR family transcriptional regulator [Polycladospora coralii]
MRDEIRRSMPLFPIGIVTKLTELTPRQIRYYEQQELIKPARTDGNQRLFSFNDVDTLLQIKSWMEKGINIAGVKEMLQQSQQELKVVQQEERTKQEMSEKELRRMLKRQLIHPERPGRTHLTHGELSRFFRH